MTPSTPLPAINAEAIQKIADLAHAQAVEIIDLPEKALPDGLVVESPAVLAVMTGDGKVELKGLGSFVDELRGKPARRRGMATAGTLESFIELTNRHANSDTAIFADADWRKPSLTAVIDYHVTANAGEHMPSAAGDDPYARFGNHRIHYAFPLSESWKIWVENSGKAMSQADFAAFLEDHIHELSSPSAMEEAEVKSKFKCSVGAPNTLIDLSRELEVTAGSRVKSKQNLSSGDRAIVFEVETSATTTAGQPVEVPGMIIVNVPIFYRGEAERVFARLRYRPAADKGVIWFYDLHRPDEAVDGRVLLDIDKVAAATGLPVYIGAPEK